jgi:branched-chain amino acid aminotransferase
MPAFSVVRLQKSLLDSLDDVPFTKNWNDTASALVQQAYLKQVRVLSL